MLPQWKPYLLEHLEGARLYQSNAGAEIEATCPFCGKPEHFYVFVDRKVRVGSKWRRPGDYVCFKCGKRGRALNLYAEIEGVPLAEVQRQIMRGVLSGEQRRESTPAEVAQRVRAERERTVARAELIDAPLPAEYVPVWDGSKWRFPKYLAERGVQRETAARWKLGYCTQGRYRGRIIIPVECPNGRSFQARDYTGRSKLRYFGPVTRGGRLVFGWASLSPESDFVVVEGPMDCLMVIQAGLPCIGLLGKKLHQPQLTMLQQHLSPEATPTVMLDPGAEDDAVQTATLLATHFRRVYLATLPKDEDPNSIGEVGVRRVYDAAVPFRGRTGRLRLKIQAMREKWG